QWRRAVQTLSDLEHQLSNQSVTPESYAHYYKFYENVRERECALFAEVRRLAMPPSDPHLVAIQTAWETYNSTHQAAWNSYQESQRASWVAYSDAMAAWARKS
ncbi:hypothetical protein BGW39_003832, partial [Mortierella sp. 14UC]